MFDLPPMLGGNNENLWDEPDVVLTYIIMALVNGMGLEMGVTLMTRGLVISGTLTSEKAYLERISTMLQEQVQFGDDDLPDEVKQSLKQLLDLRSLGEFDMSDYVEVSPDGDLAEEAEDGAWEDDDQFDIDVDDLPPPIMYLHLKDPTIVAGEPPIDFGEGSDVVIRLRMTSIDGWILGKITPDITSFIDFDNTDMKH